MEKTPQKLELIREYFHGFNEKQVEQFAALEEIYRKWNARINVISRKDIDSLYEKHILHSLSIAAAFDFPPGIQIIDIGTGGGFPGVPLAIFFPEVHFHLVDSIQKKLMVVEAVKDAIGLENITVGHSRVEKIKSVKFDFAVSRAVAPLKELWDWSKPLLRNSEFTVPGREGWSVFHSGLIVLKGGDLSIEIAESGTSPKMIEISDLFQEEYYKKKFLLYISMQ